MNHNRHTHICLFILVLFCSYVSSQTKLTLQKEFNGKIAEINQIAKNGQLQEAIIKAEDAKTFAYENFKDSYHNQMNILNMLNFYYMRSGDSENELATNIAFYKILNKNLEKEQKGFKDSFNNLAAYYQSLANPRDIIPDFIDANKRLLKQTEEAFKYRFEDQRANFLQVNIQPYHNLFQSFAYKTGYKYKTFNHLLTNNVLVTKGALLNSSKDIIKNLESLNNKIINRKIEDYRDVKDFATNQLSLNEKDRDSDFISKQARLVGLESELVLYHRKNFNEDFTLSKNWKRTQLKENEIAIEFSRFKYYNTKWTDSIIYVAHVFKKNWKIPKIIPLFEESELQSVLDNTSPKEVYFSRGSKGKHQNKNSVEDLYNLIIKPLESDIKNNTTIYFSPDGILHQIAFAALSNSNGKLLIENYNLIQINSSTAIKRKRIEPNSETTLFIGGINYDYNAVGKQKLPNTSQSLNRGLRNKRSNRGEGGVWPYLKGTKKEVENLKTIFDIKGKSSNLLSGEAAKENTLKAISGRSPNIIHIATHGFFYENGLDTDNTKDNQYKVSDNPLLRSGLLFSGANYAWKNGNNPYEKEDGILTALEISNLDLSNTDLVVLSACETGLGDIKGNEGVYGLQRAFKMAGVDLIIMSLWEVPDAETVEFMTSFYTLWLELNDIKKAFIETQRKMLKLYSNNPEKWAAFVLFE
jgi:CHAT domain-containing protein